MPPLPRLSPSRPARGWLKYHRHRHGLSLQGVANRLEVSPQAVHQFEKSEVAGTISLRQLAAVARAVGCRLTYELVPLKAAKTSAVPVGHSAIKAIPPEAHPSELPPRSSPIVDTDRFSVTAD
jgi:transcriptional regulator with XRE-family HTH domain